MLVFDKDRKRCVSPPTEDCDVPATTPAPEDSQDGGSSSGGRRSQASALPENRRRFQTPEGGLPPNLPFVPNGASLLQQPQRSPQ